MSPDQFRLDPDEQRNFRAMDQKISTLRETIAKMSRIGLPVDDLQAMLDNNIKLRDGMLREFGNPVVPRE